MSYKVYKCVGCNKGFIGREETRDYYDYASIDLYGCRQCGYDVSLAGEIVASGEGSIPKTFEDKMYHAGILALGPYGEQKDTDMFGRSAGNIQRKPPKHR